MDVSKYMEWLKLSPKHLFPLALSSGVLLFSNDNHTGILGLTSFVNQYRPIIGIIFLLSFALIVTSWGLSIFEWGKNKWLNKKRIQNMKKRLHKLTLEEKGVLSQYIQNQTRTQYLGIDSGIVKELEISGVIYRSSNVGDITHWSYNIQPWAWEYLNKHPYLVSISKEKASKLTQSGRLRRR